VAKGLKNREIAKKLGMSQHVIRNYLGIIYNKVGVSNRVELALGMRRGCVRASFDGRAPRIRLSRGWLSRLSPLL